MRENKAIIDDIDRNKEYYFEHNINSNNFLYAKAIQYLYNDLSHENYEKVKENINHL